MSTAGLIDLPQEIFSGEAPFIPAADLPPGASSGCQDVQFAMGEWSTRPGLSAVFSGVGGTTKINGLKTYTTPGLVKRCLVYDSLGNLYKETLPGSLSAISGSGMAPGLLLTSTTHFGREYMAFGDGVSGQDIPRQYDDVHLDRVSQIGPAEGPTAADSPASGNVSAGTHECVVVFVTRQGYWTAPSPPVTWTAAGGKKALITNIPTGPANVVQRLLAFTAAGSENFYHIPSTMVVNDNTTTAVTVDFTDTALLAGESVDYLFSLIELAEQNGVTNYAERLFWWGERTRMNNWRNLSFDGGWDPAVNGRPLGWSLDGFFGGGAGRESANVVWGDAFRITADGSGIMRGLITQSAVLDVDGNPLCQNNVGYSVRVRLAQSGNLTQGTLRINAQSVSEGPVGTGLAVAAIDLTTEYQEFTAQLFGPQTSLPIDLMLHVYADDTPSPSGEAFLVDNIEIFPTNTPLEGGLLRASKAFDPESYDGVTGLLEPDMPDGDVLVGAFSLRDRFYLCGYRSLFHTTDDKTNEPSSWEIELDSDEVGISSPRCIGYGDGWVVLAGRTGVYIVWANVQPVKISQEIQPVWDQINWAAQGTMWVMVDNLKKRILVGVPLGTATSPNQILYMDYQGLDTASDIASYHSVRYSNYSGKILTIGDARKWAPWTIAASSAGLIERTDGTRHVFLGSALQNGNVYDLLDGQYDDDGAGIPWSYSGHMMPTPQERQQNQLQSGRMLFGYLTGYVEGAGQMSVTAQPMGNITPVAVGTVNLTSPDETPATIASAVRANGKATITTSTAHNLRAGIDTQAILENVNDGSFDGTWALQKIVNANQFVVYQAGLPNATSAGGAVKRLVRRFEMTVDVTAERVVWTFANKGNQAGTWVRMQEYIPWFAPDPWAPVRGGSN